jgi:hypothetical protein
MPTEYSKRVSRFAGAPSTLAQISGRQGLTRCAVWASTTPIGAAGSTSSASALSSCSGEGTMTTSGSWPSRVSIRTSNRRTSS